ncbi:hypothetical protein [Bradyrhizobium sp.]|uniref:hypothetical protein n=1 Tax=Bradyrhizobium sp. TaxID=376 RepID=UPI003C71075A
MEFFYLDENGNPADAALHDPILAQGDAVRAFMASTYPWLRQQGWTVAEVRAVYADYFR